MNTISSRRTLILLLLMLLVLLFAACAQGQPEAQPPEIRYGETICVQCNMIISDERFAAGYAHEIESGRYESIAFDDIGELLESAAAHPERNVTNWYVHDYNSKEWLDATQAHFMFSENLTTPMGQGAAAFVDMAAAEDLAAEMDGVVLDWTGLREKFEAGELMVHAHAPGTMPESDMAEHGGLNITNVRANLTVPADTGSLWMMIHNDTNEEDALTGATVPGCEVIELHDMTIENDVMKMRPVEGGQIVIPAGGMVELKPGGLHVMCIGKTGEFAEGDMLDIELHFANAGTITVPATVVLPGGPMTNPNDETHTGDATIEIISPIHGAEVGHMLSVQVAATGFDLMTPGNHWHVFVDDELAQMVGSSNSVTLHDLTEGMHTIKVTMSNAEHEDLPGFDEISVMVGDVMPAAHDHNAMHQDSDAAMSMHMEETILGEAEIEGYRLQVVSHAPLHSGYNVVMAHLTDAAGAPVSDAEITFSPLMTMKDGMNHAAGVEQPELEMPGMYHGAIAFPMPSGPDLGNWSLAVSFTDPATSVSGETSFDIDVTPAKLSGSFVAPDESKIFIMAVQPIVPSVGAQPFEVFVMERAGAMDWPPVDELDLEITPWMPSMDHGSSNNANPVSTSDGHYLGQVNFSMAGPWTITIVASRNGESLGEVVFEYNIQ